LAKALFLIAKENNECFHVWGHSSEIEKLNMWNDLDALFAFIADQNDIKSLVNSELLS